MQHLIPKILVNLKKSINQNNIFFYLVENMHKYTTELISDNHIRRRTGRLRDYLSDESTSSVC
jgi:hypothetical protein